MTDRPILFSAPMVRALLEGRKTQTRRILPVTVSQGGAIYDAAGGQEDYFESEEIPGKPRYAVGDRLWVREAWRTPSRWDKLSPQQTVKSCLESGYERAWCPIQWEADRTRTHWGGWRDDKPGRLRASRHLPRAYSRVTLTVTDVRVQRLQDISEEDAIAEGYPPHEQRAKTGLAEIKDAYPIGWYAALWDNINGPDSWQANPFVAAYTFSVDLRNIDEVQP